MESNDNLVQQFKIINIIYYALGAGMLMSAAMFTFMIQSGAMPVEDSLSGIMKFVVPAMGVGSFAIGKLLYNNFAAKSKEETDETVKINNYRTASLIQWATLEGSGLFSSICYLITGDPLFLVFFAMIFVGYILSKPSISKFQQDF